MRTLVRVPSRASSPSGAAAASSAYRSVSWRCCSPRIARMLRPPGRALESPAPNIGGSGGRGAPVTGTSRSGSRLRYPGPQPDKPWPGMKGGMTDEVVDLCRDLIRIDTTNTGDPATCAGERAAAEYVAAKLAEVGLEPQVRESAPGRTSVVARYPGAARSRGALLVHGHLDAVPADASGW